MPSIRPKGIPPELIDALRYEDGALYWINSRRGGVRAGSKATHRNGTGYNLINWDKQVWKASRVIWPMHHDDTSLVIDHINRDKGDDRIENLRAITQNANQFNQGGGVTRLGDKWRVQWSSKHIAVTPDLFEAWCIRKSLEASL